MSTVKASETPGKQRLQALVFFASLPGGEGLDDDKLRPGQLVFSIAGRDKGRAYVVLAHEPGRMLRVADGSIRKVENPKRKNRRHLQASHLLAEELNLKIIQGVSPTNQEVRLAIQRLRPGGTELVDQLPKEVHDLNGEE